MDRLLVGVAIGVALGAGGVLLLRPNVQVVDQQSIAGARTSVATSAATTEATRWGSSPFEESAEASRQPGSASQPGSSSHTGASAQPGSAPTAADVAKAEAASQAEAKDDERPSDRAEQQSRQPPFLTEDFSRAIAEDRVHPRSVSSWHDEFGHQVRDPTWAASAESDLTDFFSRAGAARGVSLAGVQCRETLCEMKFTEPLGAGNQWSRMMEDWFRSGRGFGGGNAWASTEGFDDRQYIVVVVRKRPEPKP